MAQLNPPWEHTDQGVVLPDHAAHRVLVTFTYPIALPANSSTALFRVDLRTGAADPVPIDPDGEVAWATGLATSGDRVFVLYCVNREFRVSVLSLESLELLSSHRLPEVRDGHSLLHHDGALLVVSSGTDEVLAYDDRPEGLVPRGAVWRASAEGRDTHHLNSLARHGNSVLVSGFGPRASKLWASAENGYVRDITRDEVVVKDVYHPHTVSVHDGELYWCESHHARVVSRSGRTAGTDGYPRGLGWLAPQLACVGTSQGRKVSKSTGQVANPSDPGMPRGRCGLTIADLAAGRTLGFIDLGALGPEIYDVLPLPS
ncbi:DUF4915 domain-containing protein [Streptomyces sp. NPDC046870]|uniref:DUF4915 domain-containing protein n=1 Tax=Streptomyces sp. NPDC046870 TaxID=3155135 RepID=UPI00345724FB